jgi:hypothetical protein
MPLRLAVAVGASLAKHALAHHSIGLHRHLSLGGGDDILDYRAVVVRARL